MSSIDSRSVLPVILTLLLSAGAAMAQSSGFTYQGRRHCGELSAEHEQPTGRCELQSAGMALQRGMLSANVVNATSQYNLSAQ